MLDLVQPSRSGRRDIKVAHRIFAALLAALSGCADYQAQQQAAWLNEQFKTASQDCHNRFSQVTQQNIVAMAKCFNAAQEITMPLQGSNQDLVRTHIAQRLAIAEQVQSGKITVAEGAAVTSRRLSEANSEIQRRNAIAQTAAA